MLTSRLRYVKDGEIDTVKWDNCISNASNSRIYATSWHLDRTAERWDALIWNDYEYVMPLPVGMKWGIRYIYQPYFCQQLGIFPVPSFDIQALFASELVRRFKFLQFQINSQMLPEAFHSFEVLPKVNYILPLHEPYSGIASQFKKNTRYDISSAYKKGIRIVNALDSKEYAEMKRRQVAINVSSKSFEIIVKIIASG